MKILNDRLEVKQIKNYTTVDESDVKSQDKVIEYDKTMTKKSKKDR